MSNPKQPDIWPGMTAKQWRRLHRYIRHMADQLGLRDWAFELMFQPLTSNAGASCKVIYGRKLAELSFTKEWNELPPTVRRHYIIHELLHVHLWPINRRFDADQGDLTVILGRPLATLLDEDVTLDVEHAVDAIADEIAGHYPLPKVETSGT